MGIWIRQGTIVTETERFVGDVYVEDGRIAAVGPRLERRAAGDRVIDAAGLDVLPGLVDPHVHFALPVAGTVSADDWASGTAAAIAGGTTTVMDFVVPGRGEALLDVLAAWRARAKDAACDYSFHMGIAGWDGGTAGAMRAIARDEGMPSFKVMMAYKGSLMLDDGELYRVMREAAHLGAVVLVHAENGEIVATLQEELREKGDLGPEYHPLSRPSALEGEATHRALVIARLHDTDVYVVHMTCREAVEALARARAAGQRCHGETCPQYLLLDDTVFARPGFESAAYVCSPPLRPAGQGHGEALWRGLADGTLDTVGTDHCPFTMEQRRLGSGDFTRIPGGVGGVEERLQLLYTFGVRAGRFDERRLVAVASAKPARIFGLYPRKGAIAVGSDADLVLYDPSGTARLGAANQRSRGDRSVYEGLAVQGRPAYVLVGGRVALEDGRLDPRPGSGRFLARAPRPRAHAPAAAPPRA